MHQDERGRAGFGQRRGRRTISVALASAASMRTLAPVTVRLVTLLEYDMAQACGGSSGALRWSVKSE